MDTLRVKPVALLVPIAGAALVLLLPLGLEPGGRRAMAIATWMVLAWLCEPVHPAVVGLGGCFLFWATQTVGFEAAFAGFGTEIPWFVYGALALVSAVQSSRLDAALAKLFPAAVAGSFLAAAVTLSVLGLLLGLVIPSAAARGVLLAVVALGLSRRLDGTAGLSSRIPLVAVASYAAAVLGGDGPSATPALAWKLVTLVAVIAVASRFVRRAEPAVPTEPESNNGLAPVAIVLTLVALIWATTPIHGISPALVGLLAGCLVSVPGIRPGAFELKVDSMAVIVSGAAVTIPMVLHETKAAQTVVAGLHAWLGTAGHLIPTTAATYLGYVVTALFEPPSMVTADDATLAATTGLSAGALVWLATCATTAKLALYQSPALIIGASISGFTTRDVLKFGIVLAIVGAIAALVLTPA